MNIDKNEPQPSMPEVNHLSVVDKEVSQQEEVPLQENVLDWQIRTGLNLQSLSGVCEALIFTSDRPLELSKIQDRIDTSIPLELIKEAVESLQQKYQAKEHGIKLMNIGNGFQFRTDPAIADYVKKAIKSQTLALGPNALEVLAVVAYRGPVSKSEIDRIRGVDSNHILRGLIEKKLITIQGRMESELGRPSLYSTTREFLEFFNLNSLEDLPPQFELESLIPESEVGELSDVKTLMNDVVSATTSKEELEALDSLSEKIRLAKTDTELTKQMRLQDQSSGDPVYSSMDFIEFQLLKEDIAKMNVLASQSQFPVNLINELNPS